ncbi:MAG TPA: flagellar basal body rod protein FlgB [Chromatiales bacterium]|nr:flagellar basal body rod protein FlgB [Chromatiales bacterium]HEX22022.1 flagellar basal body rod protein FlgB [Chromatiales bacterium]
MRFGLEKVLGISQQALAIHSRRSEVLANNLANAETPGFKARDIDFRAALQQAGQQSKAQGSAGRLTTTHARHLGSSGVSTGGIDDLIGEMKFRSPTQPSLDGNTVDPLREKSAFMENALLYQANLRFLTGKVKMLKTALKGE